MKYYGIIRKCIKEISAYRISLYASNAGFYIILSVFPMIMLMVALLPYFGFGEEDLFHAMQGVVPQILYPLIQNVLHDMEGNSTGILLSATAVVAIWSSSRGVYSMQQGLNSIYGLNESRSYFCRRLTSMLYTILLIFALILTLVVNGFGRLIASYCQKQDVPILKIIGKLLQMRGILLLGILSILFTAMYCVFPNRKAKPIAVFPGAILAALSWLIFTGVYSYYAKVSGSYSLLYGSLSTIAMGMFWLYVCISILFYGCVLNLYIERIRPSIHK